MRLVLLRVAMLAAAAAVLCCAPARAAAPPDAGGGSAATYSVVPSGSASSATNLPAPTARFRAPSSENFGLSMIFYPMVLLLLAAAAYYFVRSGWAAGILRKSAPRKLQVAEIRPLGNRQFLVVAEYESTRLLLGVSPGRIDLLCHLGRDALEGDDFSPLVSAPPAQHTP
ncbi:MAG: flagellar biosynthetic protein FliO [Verrucomicrobiae bacterium]